MNIALNIALSSIQGQVSETRSYEQPTRLGAHGTRVQRFAVAAVLCEGISSDYGQPPTQHLALGRITGDSNDDEASVDHFALPSALWFVYTANLSVTVQPLNNPQISCILGYLR
jgi:hypothetical protein